MGKITFPFFVYSFFKIVFSYLNVECIILVKESLDFDYRIYSAISQGIFSQSQAKFRPEKRVQLIAESFY